MPSLRRALRFPIAAWAIVLACLAWPGTAGARPPDDRPPNIVILLCDDLGYGDLACYGGSQPTPNIDRLAAEGCRATDFSVAQPVCSASRAAILTGCYPNRIGIAGALGPGSRVGIGGATTIAELCRSKGYATAALGKWHLGDAEPFWPMRHGFDRFYGLPYSNDMWPLHPERPKDYPPLPLLEGDGHGMRILNPSLTPADQATLTEEVTRRAVAFIDDQRERPFLLYVAHPMPHVPLAAGKRFAGSTGKGLYADVLAELDWSTGEILAALDRNGLRERTIVVFLSDNGPWLSYGDHAGSAGPLREGKGTTWEGGVRVPCLWCWPGHVPAGSMLDRPAMAIDLLPTLATAIGAELPSGPIDGCDLGPWLAGSPPDRDPHESLAYYYDSGALQAVRSGPWKLHLPHRYATLAGQPGGHDGAPARYTNRETRLALYDLAHDLGETTDVAAEHPDVVARLLTQAERFRADLGDTLTRRAGTGLRPAGWQPSPASERPNIVLVTIDDLGWQDTSVAVTAGPTPLNDRWRTPTFEALAARGMRFANAYAAAPVCTPSRAAILTGESPARSHITYWILHQGSDTSAKHERLDPPAWRTNGLDVDAVTLPRLLAAAGYATIHVGKWHLGAEGTPAADPLALGYQVNVAGHAAGSPGSYLGRERFADNVRKGKPDAGPSVWDVPGLEAYHGQDVFLEEALAKEASAAIGSAMDRGQPFFLSFATYAVHVPITPNERLLKPYAGLDRTEAAYATMIETVDRAVGEVLATIEKAGQLRRTIVIVTSDNGGLSAHGRGATPDGSTRDRHNAPARSGKGSAYDGGLRVPLLVAWPGHVAANSQCDQVVVGEDLFPTILGMANVPVPSAVAARLDGQSILPLLEGRPDPTFATRPVLWHQPHFWGVRGPGIEPFTALRVGDWKLIAFHDGPRYELYDVAHDVGEEHDLAAREPDRLRAMREQLGVELLRRGAQMSVERASGKPVEVGAPSHPLPPER